MSALTYDVFDREYQAVVTEVLAAYSPEMQAALARHNRAWQASTTDFEEYLRRSSMRFYLAARVVRDSGAESVCDVGGFWGVLPMTLVRLGIADVTMTEALQYYGTAFDVLFQTIRASGVRVIDYDPFESSQPLGRQFDAVTVMAVLEHYPHSPRLVMERLVAMLGPGAHMYIEVPNIAYLPRRWGLLAGRSPLPDIATIYESDVPFTGHHHEYTMAELRTLCELAGITVAGSWSFNYSTRFALNARHGLRAFAESLGELIGAGLMMLRPALRECLAVCGTRSGEPVQPCGPRVRDRRAFLVGIGRAR